MTEAEAKLREFVRSKASAGDFAVDQYIDAFGRFFTPAELPLGSPQLMVVLRGKADCYQMSRFVGGRRFDTRIRGGVRLGTRWRSPPPCLVR